MNNKMSVTRALVELKRLDDRIGASIAGGKFVGRTVGKDTYRKVVGSNETPDQLARTIQGSFDKVDALIRNREAIKSAIILSNALTQVNIMGRLMSVAEAIELKKTVEFRQTYLSQLRYQLTAETTQVDKANAALDAAIDASLNSVYGSEKTKVDADLLKTISEPQKAQKEAALFDPAGIAKKIETLTEEVNQLTSELDFVLSESNAKTELTVYLSQV